VLIASYSTSVTAYCQIHNQPYLRLGIGTFYHEVLKDLVLAGLEAGIIFINEVITVTITGTFNSTLAGQFNTDNVIFYYGSTASVAIGGDFVMAAGSYTTVGTAGSFSVNGSFLLGEGATLVTEEEGIFTVLGSLTMGAGSVWYCNADLFLTVGGNATIGGAIDGTGAGMPEDAGAGAPLTGSLDGAAYAGRCNLIFAHQDPL
jgi:hypothetical protein